MGILLAHRGRIDAATELLREGRTLVEPLQEAQFTAPVFIGLVELALIAGRADEASAIATEGIERLHRTEDRYYVSYLLAIAARAEADVAETARARREPGLAAQAAERAASYAKRLADLTSTAESPDTFGGRLTSYAAVGAAEAARSRGEPDLGAWMGAVKVSRAGGAWLIAYTKYRHGDALLAARASRREAETVL